MHSPWFGEFLGTLVLVLLGNGVNAGVTLRKSYAADSGWMVIATGWGLAVLCGVLVAQAFGSPGANLNPAITLAIAISSGNYSQVLSLWSAQLLGAMCGASLMALALCAALAAHARSGGQAGRVLHRAAVPSPLANILSEAVGTAVLVLVAGAIYSHGVAKDGPANGVGQWLVASLVWGIGLSLGGTTGYAINPARDLGPRLRMRCCPSPARADRIGVMRRFRSSEISLARHWQDCCCGMRICDDRRTKPELNPWLGQACFSVWDQSHA